MVSVMDWTWLIEQIAKNKRVITEAPVPFIAALILGFGGGWTALAILHRERLALWKDQGTEYKDKLQGASSPIDAALRIDKLERELRQTQRRMLTDEQVHILQRELAGFSIPPIHYNPADLEAEEYAKQFGGCWQSGVSPTREIPREWTGVFIRVASSSNIPVGAYRFKDALNKAAVDCNFTDINTGVIARPVASGYLDLAIGRKII
jgi:hypothetical protein